MSKVMVSYRYLQPSRLDRHDGGSSLQLETSSPEGDPNPSFFEGFARRADVVATALLSVARVAGTRYYTPPNMIEARIRAADPVVTCDREQLRFESLSVCCGVYARLDVLPDGLDSQRRAAGTTNIDVNPPLRDALGKVGHGEPLRVGVGPDEVRFETMDDRIVERKVPLPERWLRSFAEVQLMASRLVPQTVLSRTVARNLLHRLPPARSRGRMWLVPSGSSLRVSTKPAPGAIHLSGPERLTALSPVLRFADRLAVHVEPGGDDALTGSCWTADLGTARLTIALSPEVSRGFSGEGGVLGSLADDQAGADAEDVRAALADVQHGDVARIAAGTAIPADRVRTALDVLSAAGAVGYDLTEAEFFSRQLPFAPDALAGMHPRLRAARHLVRAEAVVVEGDLARVVSGEDTYSLRRERSGWRCSCLWVAQHGASRGMCKHALAVGLVTQEGEVAADGAVG